MRVAAPGPGRPAGWYPALPARGRNSEADVILGEVNNGGDLGGATFATSAIRVVLDVGQVMLRKNGRHERSRSRGRFWPSVQSAFGARAKLGRAGSLSGVRWLVGVCCDVVS